MIKEGIIAEKGVTKIEYTFKNFFKDFSLLDLDYNQKGGRVHPYMAYTPITVRYFELLLAKEWKTPDLINSKQRSHIVVAGDAGDIVSYVQQFKARKSADPTNPEKGADSGTVSFNLTKIKEKVKEKVKETISGVYKGTGNTKDANPTEEVAETQKENVLKKPNIIVYMIGGATYGEVAGFRKIANQFGVNLVICTSEMINYKSVIDAFSQN